MRQKERHYISIKYLIQPKDVTIINIYFPSNNSSKYMQQKFTLLKGEIVFATITVGDFNIPFLIMGSTTRHRISKEIKDLNNFNKLTISNRHIQETVCVDQENPATIPK